MPPKLAARVRLLGAGDTNKNGPSDALPVAASFLLTPLRARWLSGRRVRSWVVICCDPGAGDAAALPAFMAARRPACWRHRGGLPGSAGHGVRDGRGPAACHRTVGGAARPGDLCPARFVTVGFDGPGGHDRADDGHRDRAAGGRRSGPVCRSRRLACPAGGGDVGGRRAAAAGFRSGSAVAAGAGRLHGRRGADHDCRSAPAGDRRAGHRAGLLRAGGVVCPWCRTDTAGDGRARGGCAGLPAAAALALAARAGPAAGRAAGQRCCGLVWLEQPRGRRCRPGPGGPAGPPAA